ncbi:uncharacterized protein B0T23DRAFT_389065, partial [Neurospora hispaniola]
MNTLSPGFLRVSRLSVVLTSQLQQVNTVGARRPSTERPACREKKSNELSVMLAPICGLQAGAHRNIASNSPGLAHLTGRRLAVV